MHRYLFIGQKQAMIGHDLVNKMPETKRPCILERVRIPPWSLAAYTAKGIDRHDNEYFSGMAV